MNLARTPITPQTKKGETLEAIGNDQLRVTVKDEENDSLSITAIFRDGSAMIATASLSDYAEGAPLHKLHHEAGSVGAEETFKDVAEAFKRHKRTFTLAPATL